ncbi:hypothetical protein D7Z26_05410 [Cohnella endophytica]|uniref:Bactofilin n=2 Tax=Cohnella endophytica TaxID=2419778 RepID=A0A494Y271_9BACL|nr:hypothetical protein D7Z26_05410 [Cohnella endophytica]
MVGTTTSAGGLFRDVKLIGESEFHGNVDCLKFTNTGEVEVNGSLKAASELKVTGECTIRGSLEARRLRGRGEIKILQGLRGEHIKFTGNIDTGGDCEIDACELQGAFNIEGLLSADHLELKMFGPCRAREIGGTALSVKRSKASKLLSIFRSSGNAGLTVDQIEGDRVQLEYTVAAVVRGKHVTVGPGCEIGRVEYGETLTVHKSAIVKQRVKQ